MENKYQVKIDDSVMPELYTFDQLINAGLLDDFDEKIKIRIIGNKEWTTARSFPFNNYEGKKSQQVIKEQHRQVLPSQPMDKIAIHNSQQNKNKTDANSIAQKIQLEHPSNLNNWNWGAFCFSWVWGLFNGLYWPLVIVALNYIPYIGVIISICICLYLGKKGNILAWRVAERNGIKSKQYMKIQNKWNTAGVIYFSLIVCIVFIFCIICVY